MVEVSYSAAARRPRHLLSLKPTTASAPRTTLSYVNSSASPATARRPRRDYVSAGVIRATCFFDGRNLRGSAKDAFGCDLDAHPVKLAEAVCQEQGWRCSGVRYYQGSPDPDRQPAESQAWVRRSAWLKAHGVEVFDRPLQYFDWHQPLPDGSSKLKTRIKEKGVDLRMGLDVMEFAGQNMFDVAVLFCRDQDLSELVPSISRSSLWHGRPIKLFSAFPTSAAKPLRGINGMDWIEIDQAMYESCISNHQ